MKHLEVSQKVILSQWWSHPLKHIQQRICSVFHYSNAPGKCNLGVFSWLCRSKTQCLMLVLIFHSTQMLHCGPKQAALSEKAHWISLIHSHEHEAGVACFLTLTGRKYGCRELRLLANHCHTTSRHRRNYQRKTNGAIDSLVVYLQPSLEKK